MKKLQLKNSDVQFRALEARQAVFSMKIRQYLHQSTEQLDHDIAERLRVGRELALEQQKKEQDVLIAVPAALYAGSNTSTMTQSPWWKQGLSWTLPAVVLFLALSGANQWQEAQRIDELAEIDAMILADDLPLNAHLDPGFIATLQPGE